MIGVRHRNNERLRIAALENEVQELIGENELLRKQLEDMKISGGSCIATEHSQSQPEEDNEYEVSSECGKILGTRKMSGESALVVLSMIMLRRNLHRSNKLTVECATRRSLEDAVGTASGSAGATTLCKAAEMHERWVAFETDSGRVSERSNTLKRCTRCGKARTAGEGHARSFCDDGFKVGSKIPYIRNLTDNGYVADEWA